MGTLAWFDLTDLTQHWPVSYFVETGTGHGDSLRCAAQWPFRALHSCDIDEATVAKARELFVDNDRVYIEHESSTVFLRSVLRRIPQNAPILFWLDAHFPGHWRGALPDAEPDIKIRLPLEEELQIIFEERLMGQDLIAIDDLRIYLDGPFSSGNVPEDLRPWCPTERSINFIYGIMGYTHDLVSYYQHEGYMLLTPKAHTSLTELTKLAENAS